MEEETREPVERAKRLLEEGWSLRKRVIKGRAYARMRRGKEEIHLGPWLPEFDELLARMGLAPEKKREKAKPGTPKPPLLVFSAGMGIGWFSLLLFAFPSFLEPIQAELPYFLSSLVTCCFLLWLSTRLILHGLGFPRSGQVLAYSGLAVILSLVATVPFWPRSPVDEPEFWFRMAYAGATAWFGLWSKRVGGLAGKSVAARAV